MRSRDNRFIICVDNDCHTDETNKQCLLDALLSCKLWYHLAITGNCGKARLMEMVFSTYQKK